MERTLTMINPNVPTWLLYSVAGNILLALLLAVAVTALVVKRRR